MTHPLHKPREAGSLKEAVAALVVACGGQRAASELCRVSRAQLARYTDDSGDNAFVGMPVDIVLALETHCGDSIVTRYLAQAQKQIVLAFAGWRDGMGRVDRPADKLAQVASETGKLLAEACRAIEAGKFDAKKSPRIRRECFETITAVSSLLESLPR